VAHADSPNFAHSFIRNPTGAFRKGPIDGLNERYLAVFIEFEYVDVQPIAAEVVYPGGQG
jgi:hypothetical protein